MYNVEEYCDFNENHMSQVSWGFFLANDRHSQDQKPNNTGLFMNETTFDITQMYMYKSQSQGSISPTKSF